MTLLALGRWFRSRYTRNGKKTDMYGPSPQGQHIVDASGHYSLVIIRSDLPKFASSNREAGTPEESKAVVQGSIAFFGTYTVDEAAKTLTQHVDSCTFPNWNGTDRKLSFTLSGDSPRRSSGHRRVSKVCHRNLARRRD